MDEKRIEERIENLEKELQNEKEKRYFMSLEVESAKTALNAKFGIVYVLLAVSMLINGLLIARVFFPT